METKVAKPGSCSTSLNHIVCPSKRNLLIEIGKVYNINCKSLNFISNETKLELIYQFHI